MVEIVQESRVATDSSVLSRLASLASRLVQAVPKEEAPLVAPGQMEGPCINDVVNELESRYRSPFSIWASDRVVDDVSHALMRGPRLTRPLFMKGALSRQHSTARHLGVLLGTEGSPIMLPVANFVDAAEFDSWRGRSAPKVVNGTAYDSRDLVRRYARLHSTPPPIPRAEVGIQPNGLPLLVAHDGAHRTAAAHRSKADFIFALELHITRLATNIIEY